GKVFEPVYDFLTTGHFHRPGDICRERLYRELEFWKIKRDFFAPCCMSMAIEEEDSGDDAPKGSYQSIEYDDQFDGLWCSNPRRQLWLLMEDPSSGTTAKVRALICSFHLG
ncbi:Potassium voltage-gated channel subfamily B member 1, partial [Toxocara canis]